MRQLMLNGVSLLSLVFLSLTATGQEQTDPYVWLEDVEGQKALDWAKTHSEAALAVLKAQPAFEQTRQKALEILNSRQRIAYPDFQGKYLYNFWQDEKNERGIWRRTTLKEYSRPSPKWEILLDIDKLSQEEGQNWVFKGAAGLYPDYSLHMVYLSKGGGDAQIAREFDTRTARFVSDGFILPEAKGSVSWLDANTLYVQTDFGPGSLTESGYPRIAKVWKRGTPLAEARTIFEGQASDVAVGCASLHTPERRYDVISREVTFYTSQNYVIEGGNPVRLEIPEDAIFGGFFKNRMLVQLRSDWQGEAVRYKQGSLIDIGYDEYLKGDRRFTVIVEPNERSSIVSHSHTRDILLVEMLNNVKSELYACRLKDGGWQKEKVNAPQLATLSVRSTDEQSNRYFFTTEGFLTPTSLVLVSEAGEARRVKSLPEFFDASRLEAGQFVATSKDGTAIPYFVVQPKGARPDGSNPTLLYGYGGFEISLRPGYSGVLGAAWLERGGTYVLANIRGGGEFGPRWHLQAIKEHRQLCYDDFAAVAEDLINRRITSPRHLGIMGGSNGGLLVGVAMTQRPDLFGAVVCQVPLLDMRRYHKLLAGASWMAEYGDPDVPEEWAYIQRYSPYQNLSADKTYPRVLFYTSTKDDRVHPGHARKMAAKMEGMGAKVFYYENTEGGHSAAATNRQRALREAISYSYLWMQLGRGRIAVP
jgi:prolyl oligopeptidase